MRLAIEETERRRNKQQQFNVDHNISPQTIAKKMQPGLREIYGITTETIKPRGKVAPANLLEKYKIHSESALDSLIRKKTNEMKKAAADLQFEKAADIRDEINLLKEHLMVFSSTPDKGS